MRDSWTGRFEVKLDGKGRLSFPGHYRHSLNDATLVLTNSQHQGKRLLDIYFMKEWDELKLRMSKLSQLNPKVAAFQRFYIAGGLEAQSDKQGRFLIPKSLREFAEFDGEVVLVGLGHKMELWNKKDWDEIFQNLTNDFENTMAGIADLELGACA